MATQVSYWPPRDGGSGGAAWGAITGTLSAQTDLDTALGIQTAAIALNTAKVGITTAQANAITANTAKVGITTAQANAITANTAKVGITTQQANAITANTAKVSFDSTASTKVGNISVTQPVDLDTMESNIAGKQDTLVSGTNIKTVNSTSLLGSGDIEIAAGGGATVNVETLTANKTLLATDDDYQYLSGSSNYNVYLPQTGVSEGKKFTFVNTNNFSSTYYFKIYNGAVSVQILYSQAMCSFIYTGTEWVDDVNASKENSAVGYAANGSNNGAAVGRGSNGSNNGVAVGYAANGSTNGVAVGLDANGSTNGVAVGYAAKTNNKGKNTVALGAYSKCERAKEFTITHTEADTNKSNTSIVGLKEISNVVDAVFAEQFLDASSARLTLLTNSLLNFTLKYNAIDSTAAEAKTWEIKGSIKNDGDVVALVGTPTKTVLGETTNASTWDIQVSADDTNNSLKLEFKGDATTIRRGGSFYLTDVRV